MILNKEAQMEKDITLKDNIKGKDVTLKEGDDFIFPRTFARNVFLNNESLETILTALETRLKDLEEKTGTVITSTDTTSIE
jgi:hypothetical protein